MGALKADFRLTTVDGVSTKFIQSIYIWRESDTPDSEGQFTYWAARVAPSNIQYETVSDSTLAGSYVDYTYVSTPRVQFKHKYDEGAELCVARAILALTEAGMNV